MASAPKVRSVSPEDPEIGRSQVFDPSKPKRKEVVIPIKSVSTSSLKDRMFTRPEDQLLIGKARRRKTHRRKSRKSKKTRKH